MPNYRWRLIDAYSIKADHVARIEGPASVSAEDRAAVKGPVVEPAAPAETGLAGGEVEPLRWLDRRVSAQR